MWWHIDDIKVLRVDDGDVKVNDTIFAFRNLNVSLFSNEVLLTYLRL